MPVKDLYYQKYLKYKNKYLNLCNQLGGGGFSMKTEGNTITFDDTKENIRFSVEELNNPKILLLLN